MRRFDDPRFAERLATVDAMAAPYVEAAELAIDDVPLPAVPSVRIALLRRVVESDLATAASASADVRARLATHSALVTSDVALELELRPLPPVLCAPQEMRQVFLNLLVNALDAIGSRGRVVARTGMDADSVWVEVLDDGCGMEPETLERIFDPFFTTKRVGEGTGLGLGIAWNIVRAQGGQIDVRSEPGAGSAFRLRLPAVAVDAVEAPAAG